MKLKIEQIINFNLVQNPLNTNMLMLLPSRPIGHDNVSDMFHFQSAKIQNIFKI